MTAIELAIRDINRMKEVLSISSAVKLAIEMQQRFHEMVPQSAAIKSSIEFAKTQQAFYRSLSPSFEHLKEMAGGYNNAFEMINRDAYVSGAVALAMQQIKTLESFELPFLKEFEEIHNRYSAMLSPALNTLKEFESFKPTFLKEYESCMERAKEVESIHNRYLLFPHVDTLPVVQRQPVLIPLPYQFKKEEPVFSSKEMARSVCKLITGCNEKAQVLPSGKDIFKPTTKMMKSITTIQDLSCNDEKTFGDFIDCLYFMVYEGAGGKDSRIKLFLSDEECQPLYDIRDIRNLYYRHDIEHGDWDGSKKKYRKIGGIFLRLIEKSLPESEIDFEEAQHAILDNLAHMLKALYKKMDLKDLGLKGEDDLRRLKGDGSI